MIFDGGWRLSQGQVPYRDVIFPFGPMAFVVQALFFKVFGVNFSATVLSAAVLNSIAGLLVVRIVSRLLPHARLIALLAGVVTVCWFQAPFGTLWFEQTAFFFGLAALVAALEGALAFGARRDWLHVLAGLFAAVSVLSKQNAGILFYPVVAGVPLIANIRAPRTALTKLALQLCGLAAGLGCFVAWVFLFSDPRQFFHYSIEITRSLAAERAPRNPIQLVAGLLTLSTYPLSIRWCALIAALAGFGALLAALLPWSQNRNQTVRFALIGWVIIACLGFQQLFIQDTMNEADNGLPWLGLVTGLAFGFAAEVLRSKGRLILHSETEQLDFSFSAIPVRKLVLAVSVLFWSAMILQGTRTSWKRYVQQFGGDSRFNQTVNVPGLRGLKWADFSYADSAQAGRLTSEPLPILRKADFEALNDWLDRNPEDFFVFGDATILYGLHRKIPPQPWLYFIDGHSYLNSDLPVVDEVVTTALRRHGIRTVVIEKISYAGGQDAAWLIHLPKLNAWIHDNLYKNREFGIYEVWTAKKD